MRPRATCVVTRPAIIRASGELIADRPPAVIPRYLLRPKSQVAWIYEQMPLPELAVVWEFLSGSSYQVECRFMDYWAQMEEQALAREQIQRRMEIVQSFQKLCEELGYAWAEEDLPFPEDWP